MPDIFLDPRVADTFSEIDLSAVGGYSAILSAFRNSRTGVLRNTDVRLNLDLLKTISFPQTWEMKKFQFSKFAADYERRGKSADHYETVFSACGRDEGRFKELVESFFQLDITIRKFLERAFEGVEIEGVSLIARFSETRQENLHFDLDAGSETHEAFRIYWNVDSAPRIWAMSHTYEDLCRVAAGRFSVEGYNERPAEDLVKLVTTRCFGGWHDRASERSAPRHMVYFDPGDCWFVDGRSVSHQVLYGHRVISTYCRIPKQGVTLERKGRALALLQGARTHEGDWIPDMRSVAAGGDIKGTWDTVFGEIGTGRVRRFNSSGLVNIHDFKERHDSRVG